MGEQAAGAEWGLLLDALAVEVRRVAALLRSVRDPEAAAVGEWNLAEVATHLSQVWLVVPALAEHDLSPVYAELPSLADRYDGSGALLRDMAELGAVTSEGVRSEPERDLGALADRIETRAARFFGRCAGRSADDLCPWLVEGVTVRRAVLTGHLLNETVVHGYDIAHADRQPWRIEPAHAARTLSGFIVPVIQALEPQALVHQDRAAGLRAVYALRIRGGDRFYFIFDDGQLRVRQASPGAVDCHISADPVAFLKVIWNRQGQWSAIARGQLLAWGRRPWLGPRLRAMLRNP